MNEMKDIPFIWQEKGALVDVLRLPINRIVVQLDVIQRPMSVRLVHGNGGGVQIRSRMHDIAPRFELGILEFSICSDQVDGALDLLVPEAFVVTTIEKLVLHEDGVQAESGISLKGLGGDEAIIVAGAQPYGLAVSVPWNAPTIKFSPEYPLDRYQRIAMS